MNLIFRLILTLTIGAAFWNCNYSKPKKSLENLRAAYNSESTSSEKYAKYAQAAINEGFDTIAQLFIAVSKSENIHAINQGKVIEKFGEDSGIAQIGNYEVRSTVENLKSALKSESYDMQTVYPRYIKVAEDEKAPEIARAFTWAWEGEKKHFRYFRKVAATGIPGTPVNIPFKWFICPTCGNIYSPEELMEKCDFCLTRQENFFGYTKEAE